MFLVRSILTLFLSTIAFVFLFMANLSGAQAPFVRNLYFSKISDQYSEYIWTMYNFCSYSGKELTGKGTCSMSKAAYAYEPYKWSSGFTRHSVYKNGSKAGYAMILIALLLTVVANSLNILSFLKRSQKLFHFYRIMTSLALTSIFIGAVLNTGLHRNGTKRIVKDGVYMASMGRTMIAFIWLPVILQSVSILVSFFWKTEERPRSSGSKVPSENPENPFRESERSAL